MRILPILLLSVCSSYQIPPRGTPEHSRACANLVASVQLIDRLYPEDGPDPWAREAFLLQAQAFAIEFDCGPIGLPARFELDREK